MEIAIGIISGCLIGFLIAYVFLKTKYVSKNELSGYRETEKELNEKKLENVSLKTQIENMKEQFASEQKLIRENHEKEIKLEKEKFENERDMTNANHIRILETLKETSDKEKQAFRDSFEQERKAMTETQNMMKQNFEETKNQIEKQWQEKINLLKSEFQALANEILEKKSDNLQNTNKEQLDAILNPLKEKFQNFEKAVRDNQVSGAENKASLEKTIEEMMKRTQEIGNDAVNLTKALKGNSKMQGDWGEMILENMLEQSGLRKNEEYFIQENQSGKSGNMRPDVIVRFPEKRSVIIDSKVSLKAYAEYIESTNEDDKKRHLKNHLKSIKDHIDGLSKKNYVQHVEHSIGYVLMFIPNEASYILAIQNDSNMASYAYGKRIVLISPTNLMMSLQLAYNLWQSERQSQNVQEIVRQGSDLYDKFVLFIENFNKISTQLKALQNTYNEAAGQLSEGKGNLVARVEKMRKLGLNPKKQISDKMLETSEEE